MVSKIQGYCSCPKNKGELAPVIVSIVLAEITVNCVEDPFLTFEILVNVWMSTVSVITVLLFAAIGSHCKEMNLLALSYEDWLLFIVSNVNYVPKLLGLAIFVDQVNLNLFRLKLLTIVAKTPLNLIFCIFAFLIAPEAKSQKKNVSLGLERNAIPILSTYMIIVIFLPIIEPHPSSRFNPALITSKCQQKDLIMLSL